MTDFERALKLLDQYTMGHADDPHMLKVIATARNFVYSGMDADKAILAAQAIHDLDADEER